METLFEILAMRRPHGGKNEVMVAEKILSRLPGVLEVFVDKHEKPMAYVYTTDSASKTLMVAHLDTVHRDELTPNPVIYDANKKLAYKTDGTPLGADDGSGIWLLFEMAAAGVKGTFLWTIGEERGGIGAKWLADNATEFLSGFDRAIAFDRRGTSDVITHQGWGGRCCSDVFAEALAGELSEKVGTTMPLLYLPDNTGVYTDTAEFTGIIPECTNISCFYDKEHSGNETLDVGGLEALRDRCLLIDWESLPTSRDPSVVEVWPGWAGNDMSYGAHVDQVTLEDLYGMTKTEIEYLCWESPEVVSELLIDLIGMEEKDAPMFDRNDWSTYGG